MNSKRFFQTPENSSSRRFSKISKLSFPKARVYFLEHLNVSPTYLSLSLSTFPTSTTIIKPKICKGQEHTGVPYTVQLLPIYSRL